jgi:hypothetical protein
MDEAKKAERARVDREISRSIAESFSEGCTCGTSRRHALAYLYANAACDFCQEDISMCSDYEGSAGHRANQSARRNR